MACIRKIGSKGGGESGHLALMMNAYVMRECVMNAYVMRECVMRECVMRECVMRECVSTAKKSF